MQFRNGNLGVCLVVVAVVLTILGSYVLSMDVEEKTVTKYAGVSELTGLFDSEQAPAYINYNPSTNYTGYYTDTDTKYFDGVTATTTTQPNQYRLNLEPTNHSTGTTPTLSGSNWASENTSFSIYYMLDQPVNGFSYSQMACNGTNSYLTTVLNNLNLNPEINRIVLKSVDGEYALDGKPATGNQSVNWIVFSSKDMWRGYNGTLNTQLFLHSQGYIDNARDNNMDTSTFRAPALSCIIDLTKNTATLYYDNDCQRLVNICNLDDVIVSFGGSYGDGYRLKVGTTALYDYSTIANPEYMDIRDGVKLEESA